MIPVNERSPVWPYFEYQGSVWVVGCSSVGLGVWARMRGEMARRDKREERSFVIVIVKSRRPPNYAQSVQVCRDYNKQLAAVTI